MSEVVPDLVALDAQIERWRADGARISDAEQPLLAWAWEALSAPQREVALEPAGLLAALRLDGESIAAALLLSAGADELTTAAQDDATRAPVLALMEGARRMDEIQALRQALDLAGIRAEVTGRPKHIYSIWKKMQRKDLGFKDLFDVRAVRVLVDEVRDCYGALGIVHDLWTPIPREFDDYIAKPKANDYRSLHTAVIGPDDKVLEVQIRTREMHQANELGIAAHWRYKEGGRRDPGLEARIAWLRQILDWRQDMTDDAELVDGLRTELFQETVYTLTPQGRVIPLPRGSTPVDFAYHVHTELGHRCRGAKVNGAIVPLTYELGNGQRVEIITTREGGPSRDWLNPQLGFLHSHRARTKVRQWFNAQNLEEAVAHGREVVEREVHRLGAAHPALDALMQTLGFDALDEGLAAVGRGEVSQRDLQHALRPPPPAMVPDPVTPVARVARAPAPQDGVLVVGLDGLLTQLARCCKPVPPDPIVGFVTRGKGVSVHRAGCGNVKRLPVERLVDAAWGNVRPDARYPMDFEITGRADGLLLQAVTDLLGKERMPVRAARVTERGLECRIVLTAETGGLARAERLLTLLSELPGVTQARRG
ncbi:MAG: bifunctional (p)ppGpp synthetase/guanosine-3',5'-bis(diphosphate) 3'-pyrophosphohydrolase [Burkholderiales bacterium]|nr:bifunctional (p)ppGpp synthetase/guanosine-3',5'-bis(diphosphate) 3'-pyrophosphohydrolase [Burkholderiales bacterium]